MGTRSRVAVRNPDNTFTSIYVHWDGYPTGVGATLKEHYTDPAKVQALMALGDLSSLDAEVGEKHPFEARGHNMCTAYGRDRGESGTESVTSPDLESLQDLTQDCGGEWLYVFTGHGWQCAKGGQSAFGMPASEKPEGLESIDYWLQRQGA